MTPSSLKLNIYIVTMIAIVLLMAIISCLSVLTHDVQKLKVAYTKACKSNVNYDVYTEAVIPIPETTTTYSSHYARFTADLVLRLVKSYKHGLLIPSCLTSVATCNSEHGKNAFWCLKSPGKVWLVFRGTCTHKEWTNNFEMQYAPKIILLLKRKATEVTFPVLTEKYETVENNIFPDTIKVHAGFIHTYMYLRERIFQFLKTLDTNVEINITGHSLGGALGLITTADILLNLPHFHGLINTYVYGTPRVGNTAFASLLNNAVGGKLNSLYLVINNADIVPTVPMAVQPNIYNPDEPYEYCHPSSMITFIKNLGSWQENHRIETYIDNI